jgi:hypothetical protein
MAAAQTRSRFIRLISDKKGETGSLFYPAFFNQKSSFLWDGRKVGEVPEMTKTIYPLVGFIYPVVIFAKNRGRIS